MQLPIINDEKEILFSTIVDKIDYNSVRKFSTLDFCHYLISIEVLFANIFLNCML
jgi:hypothetical protein